MGLMIGWALTSIFTVGICTGINPMLHHLTHDGMELRGDRIHRYVNAFCPHCHDDRPDGP